MIKKHWYIFSILIILGIAGIIRFYLLGNVPHGMTWDEAAIGYNGYAVLTTRRDEWLNRLPVSFMSFGDYKAPLAIYLNGFFTAVFGMSLFSVRLPFTIASLFAILGIILIADEIFKENKFKKYYALFTGILLSLSPWHIHYSRTGFESGMALTFMLWGMYFFIKSLKNNFKSIILSLVSVMFFLASIYTYHSSKITIPLIGLSFIILFFNNIRSAIKHLLLPAILFLIGLCPFINDALFGEGLTRAGVTVFSSDFTFLSKIVYVIKSFLIHLSPNFLLMGDTTTLRHGTGYLGVLFLTTLILIIAGIIFFITSINKLKSNKYKVLFLLLIIWGILPAAVATEVPHSNRALLALPGFILTAVYGLDFMISFLKKSKLNNTVVGSHGENNIIVKSFVGTLLAVHVLFSASFLNHYFNVFAKTSTIDFNDGYIEAFQIAKKYENGEGVEPVEKIIFTSKYGQPYIYALFVRKTNPIWYQGGSLIKYEFKADVNIGDLMRKNTLIVGSGTDDLPIHQANHLVYGSDGSIRFVIFRTQ